MIAWRLGAPPASFGSEISPPRPPRRSPSAPRRWGEIAGPDLPSYDGCPLRARVFAEGIGFAPHVASEVLALVSAAIDRLEKISVGNPLVQAGVSPTRCTPSGKASFAPSRSSPPQRGSPPASTWPSRPRRSGSSPTGEGDRLVPVPCRGEGRLLVPWSRAGDPRVPRRGRSFAGRGAAGAYCPPRTPGDRRPARGGARFVLCPRSNAAHGNGAPDVTHFVDAKIPFALGTDSLGSVPTSLSGRRCGRRGPCTKGG